MLYHEAVRTDKRQVLGRFTALDSAALRLGPNGGPTGLMLDHMANVVDP